MTRVMEISMQQVAHLHIHVCNLQRGTWLIVLTNVNRPSKLHEYSLIYRIM